MSNDIKPGDLVMVVKPLPCGCKGSRQSIGRVFVVARLSTEKSYCAYCKEPFGVITKANTADGVNYRLTRLIKIDPPKQPETVERHDEVTA